MGVLRVEDGAGLAAALAVLQRRTVIPFADEAERAQQWPTPPDGAVSYLADSGEWEGWSGDDWAEFGGPGPQGEQGDPGPAGGALISAFWQYSATTSAPPGSGQMRTDSPITTLWVSETDTDGFTRAVGLGTIQTGDVILVRAANGTAAEWEVSSTPTDAGTYWTIPVTVTSGTVTKGSRTQLNFLRDPAAGLPAGGATGQVLTKDSSTDYDTSWQTPSGGSSSAWTTYTPSWTGTITNPAIGNGTLDGRYTVMGKTLHLAFTLIAGSTTTFGSGFQVFGIPGGYSAAYGCAFGAGRLLDNSATDRRMCLGLSTTSATGFNLAVYNGASITNTVPWTWAVNDSIIFSGTIEIQ